MTIPAWLHSRKKVISVVALAALIGAPVIAAVLHPGFPITDVTLSASDVWVTNGQKLLGGRLNHQIGELDAAVTGTSAALNVLQDSSAYFLTDTTQGTVDRIDPSFVSLVDRIAVPIDSTVAYGGPTLAILSPTGQLWVVNASGHLDFNRTTTAVAAQLGAGAQVVVSKSGTVFAVSPAKKKLYTVAHPGDIVQSSTFPAVRDFQLSAVGEHPVVLDVSAHRILKADGSSLALPSGALRIQQVGQDNSYVLVATGDALLKAPLDGGTVDRVTGAPTVVTSARNISAPVWLNGCAYGAWAGSGRYLYSCDRKSPVAQDIEQTVSGDDLEFRVNGGVIALNNLRNGNAWLVTSNMRLVNNWSQVKPDDVTSQGDTGVEKPVQQSFADTLAQRTPQNRPPIAVNDTFGVRPGRTTILPVLANDTDPDGDVLTIVSVTPIRADQGHLDLIEGDRSVQFTPASGVAGTVSFRYTIDDGRGGTASADVNATIRPLSQNVAPVATRSSATQVEAGQSISYNVLNDWNDPDGDDIYLVAAVSTTADDVQFNPDGTITFTSKTGQSGSKQVNFTVADGKASASGSLTVSVQPRGSLGPVAVPDSASGFVASPIVISPLANDMSPSGDTLTLVGAKLNGGGTAIVTTDTVNATVTVQSSSVGVYYVEYTLGAGAKSTGGLIRVDIAAPVKGDPPPLAVKDIAYLRPGQPTTVMVLDNDVSPSDRVLAVQSVDVSAVASSLSVEILDNATIRVSSSSALTSQVQFQYTISDGRGTSTAGVTVVPVAPLTKHQPPVARDDSVVVRAGDIATTAVLANDTSPDSATLSVDPKLVSTSVGTGLAFVDRDRVRFQAPTTPGQYSVAYTVNDDAGESAVATVNYDVRTATEKGNHAPVAKPITSRAFADSESIIVIPLDGIDPDGDSVTLIGIDSPPQLGRIVSMTSASLVYDAYPGSAGTDQFSYTVADSYGATATADIRIGVIPRPSGALPPIAVDDTVHVKPGRTASVPVLANDSDPSGYALTVSGKLLDVEKGLVASVDSSSHVVVTASKKEGTYSLRYQVTNGHGGSDTAFVQVVVDRNAVIPPPTAIDHVISQASARGKSSVIVSTLTGAENPGGRVSDLRVSLEGHNAKDAEVLVTGEVRVHPGAKRETIAYRLTDVPDSLSSMAFIVVPPAKDAGAAPPYLKSITTQLVAMNGSKTWKLADLVVVPSGKPAVVVSAQATHSDGSPVKLSAQGLSFVAAKDFRGPASVTFLVSDATGPNDGAATHALLTIPITVGDPTFSDAPPTFTPPRITIEANGDQTHINLRDSSAHPNPAVLKQLQYTDFINPSGAVAASLNGSDLALSAPFGVQPGTSAVLTFSLRYQSFVVPGRVTVTVVSSTKPLAQTVSDSAETTRGVTVTKNVLANDSNPFAQKGQPLVLVGATINTPGTGANVTFTKNGNVTLTAGSAFIGDVGVVYTVEDATKDPARRVQGQYVLTVSDVPDKPSAPTVVAGDRQVTVHTATTARNGKDISSYTVSGAGTTKDCPPGTACVFDNLTNGRSYTFTVVARNANGQSQPSEPSASAVPFGVPAAPTGLSYSVTSNGSGDMTMSWSPAGSNGSAISTYNWQLLDTSGNVTASGSTAGSVTSVTSTAPLNQTRYFQVQAVNSGGTGAFSAPSAQKQTTAPPPWAPTHYAGTITATVCPEPDSAYPNGPYNKDHGCTDSPRGYLAVGTVIDALCYSLRGSQGKTLMINTESGYSGQGWFVTMTSTTLRAARFGGTVPDC